MLSKINISQLPGHSAMAVMLSERETSKACVRGVNQRLRKSTPASTSSKLSLSHFSFYIGDMPRPIEPVKRVFYADDLTVWAIGVKIPDLEVSINRYLEEITAYLKDNSLLISAPKSTVTLFSPDPHQAKTHPIILIEDSHLPLVQCPNIFGVYLDTSLSFHKHSGYIAERVSSMNNIFKALAGTYWGQQKEKLLMTYIGPLGLAFLTSMLKTALSTNIIPHIWKLANTVSIRKPNKDID